jgi:hypothetical protein
VNILFVEADESHELSTSVWLARIPSAALNRTGKVQSRVMHRNQFLRDPVDSGWDIIIFERLLMAPFIDKIREYQAAGVKVIARFDDAYHLMPGYIASFDFWKKSLIGIKSERDKLVQARMDVSALKQFRDGLKICDAVSTPSRLLCEDYRSAAKKMFYVPNYADLGNPAWTAPKPKHDGIIIGWGGGGTHKQSIRDSSILPALEIICRKYPEVKLMICGNERWVKETLMKRVPEEQLIFRDWVPNEEWPLVVANFDIGLAPLAGSYDDRRSWVKVLDYTILGVPWVASDRPPYKSVQGGIKIHNKRKNWLRAIRTLLDKPSTYQRLSETGLRLSRAYAGIQNHINVYLNMFDKVLKGWDNGR